MSHVAATVGRCSGAGRRGRRARSAAARRLAGALRCRMRGTSEGRQLRRWLTQLIVTERVVAAEAAARGVSADDAPAEDELLPDITARLEIGSIAAAALADPLRAGAVRPRHRRRRRQRRRRRRLPRPKPVAIRRVSTGPPRLARAGRPCPAAGGGAFDDRRAPAGRSPATGVPGVARRTPGRAGAAGARIRASRRPTSTRQHPPALNADARPWPSTSAAPRSPSDSSTRRRAGAHGHRANAERRRSRTGLGRGRRDDRRRDPRPPSGAIRGGRHRLCRARSTCAAGTVSPINIASWRGFPLRDRVAAAMPGVPVRLAGDGIVHGPRRALARRRSRCAVSCSAWWCRPVWAAGWCSTGCRTTGAPATPVTSATSSSSPTGSRAPCGGRGCVETVASGPWMTRWALANGWAAPPGADAKDAGRSGRRR